MLNPPFFDKRIVKILFLDLLISVAFQAVSHNKLASPLKIGYK